MIALLTSFFKTAIVSILSLVAAFRFDIRSHLTQDISLSLATEIGVSAEENRSALKVGT